MSHGSIWVWLKIKQEGLRRFWFMLPLTRVPFVYRFSEPQPFLGGIAGFFGGFWMASIGLLGLGNLLGMLRKIYVHLLGWLLPGFIRIVGLGGPDGVGVMGI